MKRYRRSRPPVSAPSAFVDSRFSPELIDAARPFRHAVGERWFVVETYVKVNCVCRYVYWAVDQYGQVIDGYVSERRDIASGRCFFATVLAAHRPPAGVITDWAPSVNTSLQPRPAVLQDRAHQPDRLRDSVGHPSGTSRIARVTSVNQSLTDPCQHLRRFARCLARRPRDPDLRSRRQRAEPAGRGHGLPADHSGRPDLCCGCR